MSATDSGQWPFPSQRRGETAPVIVKAAMQTKVQHAELLAMLERTALGLHAIAILNGDIGPKARDAARDLANEATAVVHRCKARQR